MDLRYLLLFSTAFCNGVRHVSVQGNPIDRVHRKTFSKRKTPQKKTEPLVKECFTPFYISKMIKEQKKEK